MFSGLLDGLLGVVCMLLTRGAGRAGHHFLSTGFAWTAVAALVGGFRLAGWHEFSATHQFLSQVSRGPGTLLLAIGLVLATLGRASLGSWLVPFLSVLGVATVVFYRDSDQFSTILLVMSLSLLLALMFRAAVSRGHDGWNRLFALGSVVAFLLAAFGVDGASKLLPNFLQPVDLLHLLLIAAYLMLWASVPHSDEQRDASIA